MAARGPPREEPVEEGALCLMNIGPKQVRKRRGLGIAALALALGAGLALLLPGAPGWWRIFLFVPFWLGLLACLQAREKT